MVETLQLPRSFFDSVIGGHQRLSVLGGAELSVLPISPLRVVERRVTLAELSSAGRSGWPRPRLRPPLRRRVVVIVPTCNIFIHAQPLRIHSVTASRDLRWFIQAEAANTRLEADDSSWAHSG